MKDVVLKVENLSKIYRLGEVGTGTLGQDFNRWVAKLRGKEDPFLKVTQENDRTKKAKSDFVKAVADINFEVKKGEILGIIGKNGAGKSTLLKLLSQITRPSTGSISSKGRIASLLEVGTGMHPEMTGRENIFLNGAILGMTKKEIDSKFDEIIDFAGCTMYVDTPVKRYSSGMRVRLGFAVAAFLEPEILIVDEVLAVGDAEFQKKAIGKMKDVTSEGKRTVLFVSHNMASIQHLCTSVMVLNNGTSIFKGDVNEGIDIYLSQNIEKSKIKLSERKDRVNGSIFRFTDVKLTENNNEIGSIKTGMQCSINIEYSLKISQKIKSIRMLLIDNKGVTRIICNTGLINKTPIVVEAIDNGSFQFNFKKFPLPKGQYSLTLSCYFDTKIGDEVEFAYNFHVDGGDYYGFGKEAKVKDGVLTEFDFEL